jgi:hypothetical protein
MRDAAVVEKVFHRAEETDDEVEVGRCAGEEAGGDAARQGARRRVLWRGGAREERAGEGVGQRIQDGLSFRRNGLMTSIFARACKGLRSPDNA